MNKYDLGLARIEKLGKLKETYDKLLDGLNEFNDGLRKLGYGKHMGTAKKVVKLINEIINSFPAVEFLDKSSYVDFFNRIKEIDEISEGMKECCRTIGSDFCSFSLFEFICLAIDLLEIATYDSLICPDYPCTGEMFFSGKFSYYEANNETKEIVVDTPEKCWEYLKENYEALENC